MRHAIKRFKTLVDGHFENGGGGVQAGVNDLDTFGIPAPSAAFCSNAAIPGGRVSSLVETPKVDWRTEWICDHQ
jgi:hypothetical protein